MLVQRLCSYSQRPFGEPGNVKTVGWSESPTLTVGTKPTMDSRCEFVVWAPNHNYVKLCLFANGERPVGGSRVSKSSAEKVGAGPEVRTVEMQRNEFGYFRAEVANVSSGARYVYQLGSATVGRPDPASRFQPDGV